jgi:hypothetical protein
MKYKNIAIFLLLAFCLLVPFALLKIKGDPYEIFPAALFPGGANRLHMGDEIIAPELKLMGKNRDTNEFVELDKLTLFKYIHIHHIIVIESREHFGALGYDGKPPVATNLYTQYASPEDIEQTKKWFREGLKEQNCVDSLLIVRETELKIDNSNGKIISETTIDEKVLNLY